jgi:metal-responsive CopG/Arc/MetJ family transcriptional regulator
MNQRSIVTGVSIEKELLRELDKRRRVISVKEGRDLPRSTYICELLKSALEHDRAENSE